MTTMLHRPLSIIVVAIALLHSPAVTAEPILIGVSMPFSGEFAVYGEAAMIGIQARVDEVNAEGGVNGRQLKLEVKDNESSPDVAARQVDEFADMGIQVVVGPVTSGVAMAMKPVAAKRKIVVVSPSATVDDLTGSDAWIFRSSFPDLAQGAALATFARRDLNFTRVAIVFDERYPYSVNLARQFRKDFERLGGSIVLDTSYAYGAFTDPEPFDADLKRIVAELVAAEPELIFAPIYPEEASPLVFAAGRAEVSARFAGSDSWDSETVWQASGSNIQGCYLTSAFSQDDPDPEAQHFVQRMEDKGTDIVDSGVALAYDAISMIVEAMRSTGATGEEIRQGLFKLEDFPLITGRTTITPDGETVKEIMLLQVKQVAEKTFQPQMLKRVSPETAE